ncbi:hypothetical protein T02_8491 [Trichinella nativa]|uniref:Uncharacterized protein n=1 Tax=Trichinella nativa TaxID=6335 RepID=A0A0V1LMY4_9BILA|nr:hypothetical protein T02_8491 [Trichinella nativa]
MEKKEEKWSKPRVSERMIDRLDRIVRWSTEVSIDTLEKMRFAEVERERFFLHYKDTMNKICYHVHRRNKRPMLH